LLPDITQRRYDYDAFERAAAASPVAILLPALIADAVQEMRRQTPRCRMMRGAADMLFCAESAMRQYNMMMMLRR